MAVPIHKLTNTELYNTLSAVTLSFADNTNTAVHFRAETISQHYRL